MTTGGPRDCRCGRGMQCLAVDPRNQEVLYAGSHGEGVWKSTSRGNDWTRSEFSEPNVFSLAVSPVDGALYVGTEPSKLFVSRDEGRSWCELEALQQIPSRPSWSFPPRPWTSHVARLLPARTTRCYYLLELSWAASCGARTAARRGAIIQSAQKDVHALTWHPTASGRVYEAGGGGAAWSRDGGRAWQPADIGRDRHYTWGLVVDPDDPDCWFVSANPGARLAHYGPRAPKPTSITGRMQGPGSHLAADCRSRSTASHMYWRWRRTHCLQV